MTDAAVLAERAEIDAIADGMTLVHLLDRNAADYPDKPAIHWKEDDWKSLSWADYRRSVHEAAAGLQTLGVGAG